MNYRSVARQLTDAYGPGLPIRHLTYTPPTSFDEQRDTETPPELRALHARGA
ncbi:MAG: hypothetical protein U0R64_05955 [Candidatus Nanopelagicales bacterium]